MFGLTRDELAAVARQTGFASNPLEKAMRMLDILATLKAHPALQGIFELKGGTALNLFFLDLPRLSIDLDFNYVGALAVGEMRSERRRITEEIQRAFSHEYAVVLTKDAYALSQFSLAYRTLSGSSDTLRVEINYLLRQPILVPGLRRCSGLSPDLEFLCPRIEELAAGKIVALLARYTARDLFDVHQVAVGSLPLDRSLLRPLVIFFAILSRFSVIELFKTDFSRVTHKRIRNDLVPMLKMGEYPERESLVSAAENFLVPLVTLEEHEIKAISDFYASGKLDLDALVQQKGLHERMATSPALAWRIQNTLRCLKTKPPGS